MNTKTKATTEVPEASPEEKRLYDVTARIGEEQIQAIQRQEFVQELLKGLTPGLTGKVSGELGLDPTATDAEGLGIGVADERLIRQRGEEELASGYSDLDQQLSQGLGLLKNELAPSRGLRPSDTPILDRGGLMLQENLRQKQQLSRSVRAGTSDRLLDLSARAKQNRLQLLSGLSGLGIAPQGNTAAAAQGMTQGRMGQGSQSSSALNTNLIGTGISTAASIAYAACSADRKDLHGQVDAGAVLAGLRELTIYRWNYKGETLTHLGPTAEDFQATFGVGDGKTLHLADVMGVLLAAMKGLAEEVNRGA